MPTTITVNILDVEITESGIKHYFDNKEWTLSRTETKDFEQERWEEKLKYLSDQGSELIADFRPDEAFDVYFTSATSNKILRDYVARYDPASNCLSVYHGSRRRQAQFKKIEERNLKRPIRLGFKVNNGS